MGNKAKAWRRALEKKLIVLALLAPCWPPALATVAQVPLQFDLPSGPLSQALIEIAKRSGTIVSFNPGLVEGRVAAPVQGVFTPLQAFEQALKGNDLAIEITADGAVTLQQKRPAPAQAATTGTLASPVAREQPPVDTAPHYFASLQPVLVLASADGVSEMGLKPVTASTATRTDTPLSELPQAVSVVTREALDLQGVNATPTDALRYVTGVTAHVNDAGQGLAPSLMVRGMPALYSLSGMRTLRGGLAIDSAFLDRIEVLKGPSGVVGGVADFGGRGGVINLVRRSIDTQPHVEVKQGISSRDSGTLRLEFDAADELAARTYWRAVAYGSRSGRTDGGYDPQHAGGLLAALGYRGADFKATLTLQADQRRVAPAPSSRGGMPRGDGGFTALEDGQMPSVEASDGLSWRSRDVEVDLDWRLSPQWRMTWKGRVETVDSDMRHHRYWTLDDTEAGVDLVRRRSEARSAAMQWGVIGDISTGPMKHRVLLALDLDRWRLQRGDGFASWAVDPASYEPGVTPLPATPDSGDAQTLTGRTTRERKHATLLQDQIRLGSWIARLALQRSHSPEFYDNAELKGPRATNWDAGLLYQLTPTASVYAGAQHSVEVDGRAADFQLFDGTDAPLRKVRQAQAGTKFDLLERRLALTLEAFRLRQLNTLQSSSQLPGSGIFALPGRSTDGVEAELSGRALPALDLQLGLSFIRARETVPGPESEAPQAVELQATGVPARSMHVLARYRLPSTQPVRNSIGLAFRAYSASWAVPPNPTSSAPSQLRLPGGAQLDLSWTRSAEHWTLGVSIENVFDRQLYGTQSAPGYIPLQPGRSLGLTATFTD